MSLFEQLKVTRREVARRAGVFAYMIFSDSTLLDMSRRRPATVGQLLDVPGVGRLKAARYGSEFLKTIREYDG